MTCRSHRSRDRPWTGATFKWADCPSTARIVSRSFTALNQCPGASARSNPTTAEGPGPRSSSRRPMSVMDAGSGDHPAHSVMVAGRSPPAHPLARSAAAAGAPCRVLSDARAHSPRLFSAACFCPGRCRWRRATGRGARRGLRRAAAGRLAACTCRDACRPFRGASPPRGPLPAGRRRPGAVRRGALAYTASTVAR